MIKKKIKSLCTERNKKNRSKKDWNKDKEETKVKIRRRKRTVGAESVYRAKSLYCVSAASVFTPYHYFFKNFFIFSKYSPFSTIPQVFSSLSTFLGFVLTCEEKLFLKSVISATAATAANINYL